MKTYAAKNLSKILKIAKNIGLLYKTKPDMDKELF